MNRKTLGAGAALIGILAVGAVSVAGMSNLSAYNDQVSAAQEAALAADAARVTRIWENTAEHRAAYETVRLAIYDDAYADHEAAIADAEASVAAASGKVDASASAAVITEASLIGTPAQMHERARVLAAEAQTVREAVAAYDAEQARLAEEARLAAEAAAAAAEPEPEYYEASGGGSSGGGGGGGRGVDHVEYVAGYGGTGLIDACVGSVMYDYGWKVGLAEHWSCGGSDFPQWAGAIVEIPGYGIYEVQGIWAVLDINVDDTGDVPGGFTYQTCLGGNTSTMSFIGLVQIG